MWFLLAACSTPSPPAATPPKGTPGPPQVRTSRVDAKPTSAPSPSRCGLALDAAGTNAIYARLGELAKTDCVFEEIHTVHTRARLGFEPAAGEPMLYGELVINACAKPPAPSGTVYGFQPSEALAKRCPQAVQAVQALVAADGLPAPTKL